MRRFAAALALAFPLCASADLVHVEYEGVVTFVTREVCGCDPTRDYAPDHPEFTAYSVGDRIHGFLTIDLAAAPPDRRPLDPEVGIYRTQTQNGDFISGNGAPRINTVFQDHISVRDATDDIRDEHYLITDQWLTPNGTGQLAVNMISRPGGPDLVTGEGIAQTIDVTPTSGLELGGHLSKVVQGAKGRIAVSLRLLFERVKVTPGQCKA